MSMNATDDASSAAATLRAKVDLPEPVPPATPMMSGFIGLKGERVVPAPPRHYVFAMRSIAVLTFLAAAACTPRAGAPAPADTLSLVIAGTTDTHGWVRGW